VARAPIVPPRPTCAVILAEIAGIGIKVCMPIGVIVPTIILESPAVDSAIASALIAQVPKEGAPTVVGPGPKCIDVYFGITVSVGETAVYDCAAGGIGAFGKHVVSVLKEGFGEEGGCSDRETC